jgi:hypothetical protein
MLNKAKNYKCFLNQTVNEFQNMIDMLIGKIHDLRREKYPITHDDTSGSKSESDEPLDKYQTFTVEMTSLTSSVRPTKRRKLTRSHVFSRLQLI